MKFRILIAAAALLLSGCQTNGEPSDGSALRFICRTGGVSLNALATVKSSLNMNTQAIITRSVNDVIHPFCGQDMQPTLSEVAQIGLTVAITQLAVYLLQPTTNVASFAAIEPEWPAIRDAWLAARARWNSPT